MPSLTVVRSPLKSPSSSPGTTAGTSAASAESISTKLTPYATITAKISQTRAAVSTSSSTGSRAAMARCRPISSGRRRNRSASTPISGATRVGPQVPRVTRPARLLDPVRSFTQIPATRSMAAVPKPDTSTPAR
ncbi:hypothetical protein B0E53_04169 [Micromonospora sp. MH33]|nr:hypothetical protein B0E53_04169 [Micromonospora sp. MH33]